MILTLNNTKLIQTGLAGFMIFVGVILKNGGEQMGMKMSDPSSIIGMILFVIGWICIVFSVVGMPGRKLKYLFTMKLKTFLSYIGALLVVISVMSMKMLNLTDAQKKPFGIMFILGWILFASSVGMGKSMKSKQLSVLALISVLSSMLYILPKQRMLKIVDGPGMSLFSICFILLTLANSMN